MHTHFIDSIFESINYELDFTTMYLFNDLLYHMISMLIFHTNIDLFSNLLD